MNFLIMAKKRNFILLHLRKLSADSHNFISNIQLSYFKGNLASGNYYKILNHPYFSLYSIKISFKDLIFLGWISLLQDCHSIAIVQRQPFRWKNIFTYARILFLVNGNPIIVAHSSYPDLLQNTHSFVSTFLLFGQTDKHPLEWAQNIFLSFIQIKKKSQHIYIRTRKLILRKLEIWDAFTFLNRLEERF